MASAAIADVFVAAMATATHTVSGVASSRGTGEGRPVGIHGSWPVAHRWQASRPAPERDLLAATRSGECHRKIPPTSGGLVNRRMRTRMSGGVVGERR